MEGFDAEFTDIVDYILKITYQIWEGKQPELCHRYYSEDCPVFTLTGYTEGAAEVTRNTCSTLSSFPDRTLKADNIVWGGNAKEGFHTSHLIDTAMTNMGPSEFGSPTGRHARFQVIAHCIVRENRIVKEWLVRDNYALCQQMGFDPEERARLLATRSLDDQPVYSAWLDEEFMRVQSNGSAPSPDGDYSERGASLASQLSALWNEGDLGSLEKIYAEKAVVHASARPDLTGTASITAFYSTLKAALPGARISLDYICENSMLDGDYVAIRWCLAGNHEGDEPWGPATGAPVLILGESQYRLEGGRVVEEWMVFDELAIMTQIERARLAGSRLVSPLVVRDSDVMFKSKEHDVIVSATALAQSTWQQWGS